LEGLKVSGFVCTKDWSQYSINYFH